MLIPVHRPRRIIAWLAGALVALAAIAIVVTRRREPPLAPAPIAPPATPPAAATATPSRITEPIAYLAAASDAPVIAVASSHHVWISRDDGQTFTPALRDDGAEIYAVSVEPTGRVHALWGERKQWRSPGGGGVDTTEFALGTAELDGRERWRPTHSMTAPPLDTRDGWIVGSGAPVIGSNDGESWTPVPESEAWHAWLASIDDRHTVRFLASRMAPPKSCDDCAHGLALLATRDGQNLTTLWTMLDRTAMFTEQFPSEILACAGFAGSTLYLVARERRGLRLIAVTGDGKLRKAEALGAELAPDVTCTIAGNDRAAYLALGDDLIRIDGDAQRVAPAGAIAPRSPHDRPDMAVDEHGRVLYIADACLWRYTESGASRRHPVVCGPRR